MQTSYFGISKGAPNAVAICRYPPSWWSGRTYIKLAPSKELLIDRLEGKLGDEEFGMRYHAETLSKLDPTTIYSELGEDAILLCWEPVGKFCHRHLVAKWFEIELGLIVREVEKPQKNARLESRLETFMGG